MSAYPGLSGCIVHPGVTPGSYQYRTHIEDPSDATIYSGGVWNGVAIGDADSDRYVILGIWGHNNTRTVSSVTIGGVSASLVTDGTDSARIQGSNATAEFWIAKVPTGTIANIVIQWSGPQSRCGSGVWTARRLKTVEAVDVGSSTSASPASATISTASTGFVLAMHGQNTAGACTWANVTERYDATIESGTIHSGADDSTNGANVTPIVTFTGGPNVRTSLFVSFELEGGAPSVSRILDNYSNVTGAWSMSRTLLTSFAGNALYDTDTGVSSLKDQTGNDRHLLQATAANQPSIVSAGPNNRYAASFDGSNDALSHSLASDLISASTGYMIYAGIARSIPNPSNAFVVFGTIGAPVALIWLWNDGGTLKWYGINNDGSADVVEEVVDDPIGKVVILEWMHESGNFKMRVNGGAWHSTPSGNTALASYVFGIPASGEKDVFEMVTFNAIPTEGERDALCANMMSRYGA